MKKSYNEIYREAANFLLENGSYEGHLIKSDNSIANAMSLYAFNHYDVNAADDTQAKNALCDEMNKMDWMY